MESIRLTLPYCNPYLTKTDLGMVVPMQETEFPNQLTAAVNLIVRKVWNLCSIRYSMTAFWFFFVCFFLTFLYNYHKLDVYGQKIAFTSKTLTITETKIKTFCTIKKRPTSPTCNLPGGGGGFGKGEDGQIHCFSYRWSRWMDNKNRCWNSSLVRCSE